MSGLGRIGRAVAVRPGEGRVVALVAGAFAAIEGGRGLGEVAVNTIVLSRLGGAALPPLYIGLGVVGLVTTLAYGAALARNHSERFFPALMGALAAVLLGLWLVALSGADLAYPALWIGVYVTGMLLLTATWTVAGTVFHARQAKRLFPLCTSAAIVGSFLGQLASGPAAVVVGAENLVLAEAVLIGLAALLIIELGQRLRPARIAAGSRPSVGEALRVGAAYVAGSPLMRLVAVAYLLFSVLLFSVSYPFLGAMSEAFPGEGELATALGLFSAAVTAVSFGMAALLANRLYASLGMGTVALVLPLVYLLGFGVWIVRFTLATALVVSFAQQVTQRGVSNAAWSAFFSVVPAGRRGPVLAFIDGVPGQVGTVIAGVLLIVATGLAAEQVYIVGAATAAATVVVVLGIRRVYPASLVRTLRESPAERVLEGGHDLAGLGRDPRVVAELRATTHDARPADRRLAAELLGRMGAREALDDLARLTADEDVHVRRAAVVSLGALVAGDGGRHADSGDGRSAPLAPPDAVARALGDPDPAVRVAAVAAFVPGIPIDPGQEPLRRRLAEDPHPDVRGELAVALGRAESGDADALLSSLLAGASTQEQVAGLRAAARLGPTSRAAVPPALATHPDPDVRAAALEALAVTSDADADPRPFVLALDDDASAVRTEAARALRRMPAATPALVEMLPRAPLRVAAGILSAIEPHVAMVRGPLVAWAVAQVSRAHDLRRAAHVLATAEAAVPGGSADAQAASTATFLTQVVRARERDLEALLLSAVGILGAPEATGLIRRCLRSVDPETRAQAIEALDALGDGRLTRAVVRYLDSDVEAQQAGGQPGSEAIPDVARSLSADPDPWVRALALRTLSEHLDAERQVLLERTRRDEHPIVRAFGPAEASRDMPEGRGRLDDIERMLVLRGVPLFEALTPEDLQRVAMSASERAWLGGEAVMTEGELGDELVVIVEGSVRVVRREGDVERIVRTYGVGDHIGELAVLRERPRAASVIAEDPGVRGLVIGGAALQSILRERPEAAMAMLATLAERLSRQ